MTSSAPPTSDLMALAKAALQALSAKGLAPTPANYEACFLDSARRRGASEEVVAKLRGPSARPVPDADEAVDRTVCVVLDLALRAAINDMGSPESVRELLGRVLAIYRAGNLELHQREVLAALKSAARRGLAGQFDFDPDDLLRTPTPTPSSGGVSEDFPGPVSLKVLRVVLRLVTVQGRREVETVKILGRVLKLVEQGTLQTQSIEVISHLQRLCAVGGPPTTVGDVDPMGGGSAEALTGACLSLLRLIEPAVAHSERDSKIIAALEASLVKDADEAEAVAEGAQKLGKRLARYFQSIPEQRKEMKDLIGVVMLTLRSASRGSDKFTDRLQEFSKQVESVDDPEDIIAIRDAILRESRTLETDIASMKAEFDTVNDTVRKAHAQIAKLQSELVKTRSLSLMDPLTGVPNRRGFDDWVERVLRTSDGQLVPFAFMVFDIDHFKRVNDTYGHMAGDQVLREVAGRIARTVRDGDFVSRFGGEEFCVALPGGTLDEACRVADRVLQVFRATPVSTDEATIEVRSSVGAAECREGETMEAVFQRSDQALYLAKESGRDRCCTERDLPADAAEATP